MAAKRSNADILEDLRIGLADFQLVSSPNNRIFFARIGPKLDVSPALNKLQSFRVHRITGDGRCMFRALVKGMAINKSLNLSLREERDNADELRMAIKEMQNYLRKKEQKEARQRELCEGLQLYKSGKYHDALEKFESVLGSKPKSNETLVASCNVACCYASLISW